LNGLGNAHNEPETPLATVLIADDSAPFCDAVAAYLNSRGYGVCCAPDGAQALRLLRERTIDLLLVDLLMPKMGGAELILTMQADPKLCRMPVVVVTAAVEESVERELRPVVQAWLLKSAISLTEIAECVGHHLAGARGTTRHRFGLGGVPTPLPLTSPRDGTR
jgi:CheY-like chemotaxis protein